VRAWEKLGATQMCVNVAGPGIEGVESNLRRLEEVRGELRSAGLWTDAAERAP
jgi:hypothetical protein